MILGEVRKERFDGLCRLEAEVRWEGAARAPQQLWLEVAADGPLQPRAAAAAFFPVAAVAAQFHGEHRVRVEGALDPTLAAGVDDACAAFHRWTPGSAPPPRIEVDVDARVEAARPPAHSALLFSGGVDSAASLIDNHARFPAGHPRRIRTGLAVYGLDASTDADPRRPDDFLLQAASRAGIDLLAVRTNVRALDPSVAFWWHRAQSATWSGVAHAFVPELTDVVVGSDEPITCAPVHGSNPLLDDCFSSTELQMHHGVLRMSRQERLALVAATPRGLDGLQVCNAPRSHWRPLNCGRCEKCVRTMLGLVALGILEQASTFPAATLDAALVRRVSPADAALRLEYAELLPLLPAVGRNDLADAVRVILRRTRWLDVKRTGRLVDKRLLGGAMRRAKHRARSRGAVTTSQPIPLDRTDRQERSNGTSDHHRRPSRPALGDRAVVGPPLRDHARRR